MKRMLVLGLVMLLGVGSVLAVTDTCNLTVTCNITQSVNIEETSVNASASAATRANIVAPPMTIVNESGTAAASVLRVGLSVTGTPGGSSLGTTLNDVGIEKWALAAVFQKTGTPAVGDYENADVLTASTQYWSATQFTPASNGYTANLYKLVSTNADTKVADGDSAAYKRKAYIRVDTPAATQYNTQQTFTLTAEATLIP